MAVDLEVLSRFVGHLGAPQAPVFGGAVRIANRSCVGGAVNRKQGPLNSWRKNSFFKPRSRQFDHCLGQEATKAMGDSSGVISVALKLYDCRIGKSVVTSVV
jgi:hypothetical protein